MNNNEFIEKVANMSLEELLKNIITVQKELNEDQYELFKSFKETIDNLIKCEEHNESTEKACTLVYEYLIYKLMGGK